MKGRSIYKIKFPKCKKVHAWNGWYILEPNKILRECKFCGEIQNRKEFIQARKERKERLILVKHHIDLFWG